MLRLSTLALLAASVPAFAQEINVYSHRQPELIQPLVDAFTAETGIAVNVAFVDKGMAERLEAEGDRSPADRPDRRHRAPHADRRCGRHPCHPVRKPWTPTFPAELRDPEGHWFGLTSRARVVYASKDRASTRRRHHLRRPRLDKGATSAPARAFTTYNISPPSLAR